MASRNQNWTSIIINSLKLNPDAIITGKMFGNGVYFAPSSMKNWNYTSYRGTSWANGDADVAFMGLYATAYGTPKRCRYMGCYHRLQKNGTSCESKLFTCT